MNEIVARSQEEGWEFFKGRMTVILSLFFSSPLLTPLPSAVAVVALFHRECTGLQRLEGFSASFKSVMMGERAVVIRQLQWRVLDTQQSCRLRPARRKAVSYDMTKRVEVKRPIPKGISNLFLVAACPISGFRH
jgi:hypothetical protein